MDHDRAPEDPLRGREVSCRPLAVFFDALAEKGLAPERLVEGTGYSVSHFRRPGERVTWAAFVVFMRNAGTLWTEAELMDIGGRVMEHPLLRPLYVVARLLFTVEDAYLWVFSPRGPAARMFTTETVGVRRVEANVLEIDVLMRPGYEPSPENFVVTAGSLRDVSKALGFGPAHVSLESRAGGARYRVTLPYGGGRLAWIRRAAQWPFVARAAAAELRAAHDALDERHVEMQRLLERMPVGCLVTDAEGRITYLNPQGEQIFGHAFAEVVGREPWKVFAPEPARHAMQETLLRASVGPRGFRVVQDAVTRTGRRIQCEWTHTPLGSTQDGLGGTLSMFQDVTEKQLLEDQLRQAQKMEGIGRLAAGIAHDFNNLLMVILGYADRLREDLDGGDPKLDLAREDGLRAVDRIVGAADRAATLTRQLLAFSRQQVLDPKVIDLDAFVREMEVMLHGLIGEQIEIRYFTGAERPGNVRADRGQLTQVVMNLAVNARDAMPGGGQLTLETGNVDLGPEYAASHPDVLPGRYVMLAVSDTGHGMDEGVRSRIFDPFFTTKGRGSGLGLSTVYGIVKQSLGHVAVYSEPGRGATFKVYLPRVDDEVTAEVPVPDLASSSGSEAILLVEDEPGVRAVTAEMLSHNGYVVHVARDPDDAIRIAREEALDLVLTDVVMPRMGGRELAEAVRAVRPGVTVLFMSGYTDNAIVHHGVLDEGVAFLQKPFTAAVLARKVRETLDGARE